MNILFSKKNIINILFGLIPLSFIIGNLLININIILIIFFSIFFYKKKLFKINFSKIDKVITIFFIYLIFLGFISTIYKYFYENLNDFTVLIKSFTFLRFLILYFIIKYLLRNNILNLKYFFFSSSIFVSIIILDVIFQFIFGFNIFGFERLYPRHVTSFFTDEAIAGSYIQRFSLFILFLFPIFWNSEKKINIFLISSVIAIATFASIILAGNRMPLLLFLFSVLLIVFFQKNLRKYIVFFLVLLSLIFLCLYNFSPNIKTHYGSFAVKSYRIVNSLVTGNIDPKNPGWLFHGHFKEFYAGYETWKLNKFFGHGVKSFKYNCPKTKVINCGPHPHNYYLELMADLGIVGLAIIVYLYFYLIWEYYRKGKNLKLSFLHNNYLNIFFILFFVELFPIKTTGSFFTTGNATYLFLILAFLSSLLKKDNLIKN